MERIQTRRSPAGTQAEDQENPSVAIDWARKEPQTLAKVKQGLRAVVYARVSTQEQAQKKTSVPDQLEVCHEIIKKKGWTFIQEYKDEGVSGHLVVERYGLQSMLRDAREHRFDLIVVKDYDRFARDKDAAGIIRKELKELGIQTFSVNTPVDPKPPGEYDPDEDDLGTIVETISDMRSDLERKQIARRMKNGKMSKAKAGSIPNRAPYGYRIIRTLEGTKIKRNIETNEEEASRVRFIFNSYAQGKGHRKIAIELNRKGWKSPNGNQWHTATIRYILGIQRIPERSGGDGDMPTTRKPKNGEGVKRWATSAQGHTKPS
jgi:site-specific DNA recombinase